MKPVVSRVPERVEQAHIIKLLRSLGAAVYVLGHPSPADGRRSRGTGQTPGIPDLWFVMPARNGRSTHAGWIEVKARDGRLREAQEVFRRECVHAGITHVVGSLDDVIAWLLVCGHLQPEHVPHYRLPVPQP